MNKDLKKLVCDIKGVQVKQHGFLAMRIGKLLLKHALKFKLSWPQMVRVFGRSKNA